MNQGIRGLLHVVKIGDVTCFVIPTGTVWVEVASYSPSEITDENMTHTAMQCSLRSASDTAIRQLLHELDKLDSEAVERWAAKMGRLHNFREAERLSKIVAVHLGKRENR